MQYLKFVETIELTSSGGIPITRNGAPVTLSHLEFLLQQVADKTFTEGLDGGESVELIYDTRKLLKAQADSARERKYWEIEQNSMADRLSKAILRPQGGYSGELSHNLIDLIKSAKTMSETKPDTSRE